MSMEVSKPFGGAGACLLHATWLSWRMRLGRSPECLARFASMSSSPLQFVNAVTSSLLLLAEPPLGSFSKLRRPIGATMGQQRPGHARHLVGERHRHDLEGSPRQELREPGILPGILLGAPQHS